ncbi:hypothetical protein MN608_07567 [Microdochium nivale]|nr:hypothetical protein MN608_07567 [Microdochium nivale]
MSSPALLQQPYRSPFTDHGLDSATKQPRCEQYKRQPGIQGCVGLAKNTSATPLTGLDGSRPAQRPPHHIITSSSCSAHCPVVIFMPRRSRAASQKTSFGSVAGGTRSPSSISTTSQSPV